MSHPATIAPGATGSPGSEPPLLAVEGLAKRYGRVWALEHASFEVRRGEILGLIGPNGSGKTTLFSCVSGLIPTTAGRVTATGVDLDGDRRKQTLFFVPDGVRPWAAQSVRAAVESVAALFGVTGARVDDVLAELSLGPLAAARMGTLSKGEHRR